MSYRAALGTWGIVWIWRKEASPVLSDLRHFRASASQKQQAVFKQIDAGLSLGTRCLLCTAQVEPVTRVPGQTHPARAPAARHTPRPGVDLCSSEEVSHTPTEGFPIVFAHSSLKRLNGSLRS